MQISTFAELVRAARDELQPQRLLFVFMVAELPEGSNSEQRAAFDAGHGGVLVPLMAVDKAPEDLTTFAALVEESRAAGPPWTLMFAAALSGSDGRPPSSAAVDAALQRMVDHLKSGSHAAFVPFNRDGHAVRLS